MVSSEAGRSAVLAEDLHRTVYRILVTLRNPGMDGYSQALLRKAKQLGFSELTSLHTEKLFFLQGSLSLSDAQHLAQMLLLDPVTENFLVEPYKSRGENGEEFGTGSLIVIETTFLPGVTDPPGENLVRAARLLGINGLQNAATGTRFLLEGDIDLEQAHVVAGGILANGVVQRYVINKRIAPPFTPIESDDPTIELISLRDLTAEELLQISKDRRLSMDLPEMKAIQTYYQAEGRDATDVELETLAQTWSEHCVHKTFKAQISYSGPLPGDASDSMVEQQIDGLLATYIRKATEEINRPWVRSAFVDNAGIIAFDGQYDLAFKVETHNHPSALEPFGGANTGIGGVVRDILGVSARPIANTDVLCFGPTSIPPGDLPAGVLHPRRIADGVVAGIEDYGNKMGIPTVNGSIHYQTGYTANPLVFCGCLGILPRESHRTEVQAGDLIVAIGGRTGRDGLRGATFSSMEMDISTSEIAGSAVQIGNPIEEKQVQEVIIRARDEGLYNAITDCGAGGFSSAVGEMGDNVGARVDLKQVPLKYPGLRPWEIWLSEAQERMVLAVPPHNWARLQAIAREQDVEATCLGEFEESGRLRIFYADDLVGDLSMDFLHDGLPRRYLQATWRSPQPELEIDLQTPEISTPESLLKLLAHPDIRSKENVVRRYDHEVQGGTAVKPLVGSANQGPSDAAVLLPYEGQEAAEPRGVALGNGICPNYGRLDPYRMAWAAIDEALRNIVAVGADPETIAILDNFCWGNPDFPDRLGSLVRCAQGCYDAALAYKTPFISGKDSLYNEYTGADGQKHAIPGTLLISSVGIIPSVNRAVTMDLKQSGSFLFIIGDTRGELGASHFSLIGSPVQPQHQVVPQPVRDAASRFQALHLAIKANLVLSCHDCSEGGLAVALAEMCVAGEIGAHIELRAVPRDPYSAYAADEAILFSESLSRFIVEVSPKNADLFKEMMGDLPCACIGVTGGERLHIAGHMDPQKISIDVPLSSLEQAWRGHLSSSLPLLPAPARERKVKMDAYAPAVHTRLPSVLILHANGTNRDRDAALACHLAGGAPEIVHVNQILTGDRDLLDYHMLVVPGGFSYGDDLGAGVLWAADLEHLFGGTVRQFIADGRPVLGICNGFQTLVKAGILPGSPLSNPSTGEGYMRRKVTLTYNEQAHFECRWVYLEPQKASSSLFIRGLDEPIFCPVAHGEGRIAVDTPGTIQTLWEQKLVALTYAQPDRPYEENHSFPWQHPQRGRGGGGLDGLRIFKNGLKYA
jgi:phosphoribosylformylglycinamidine synthase II